MKLKRKKKLRWAPLFFNKLNKHEIISSTYARFHHHFVLTKLQLQK